MSIACHPLGVGHFMCFRRSLLGTAVLAAGGPQQLRATAASPFLPPEQCPPEPQHAAAPQEQSWSWESSLGGDTTAPEPPGLWFGGGISRALQPSPFAGRQPALRGSHSPRGGQPEAEGSPGQGRASPAVQRIPAAAARPLPSPTCGTCQYLPSSQRCLQGSIN